MEQMGNDEEAASGVINKLITRSKSSDQFSACHFTPLKCNKKLLNSGSLIVKQRNHPSIGLLGGLKVGIVRVYERNVYESFIL